MRIIFGVLSVILLAACASHNNQVAIKPGEFPGPTVGQGSYNEAIGQMALEKEIGIHGYVVRAHYTLVAPGGIIGQHSHKNRPMIGYFLEGEATETKKDLDGKILVRTIKADESELEPNGITHWWLNQSSETNGILGIDIFQDPNPDSCNCKSAPRTTSFLPPTNSDTGRVEDMGQFDLGQQFPDNSEFKGYIMRGRRQTLLPHQRTKLENNIGKIGMTYLVKGEALQNSSDAEPSIRRTGAVFYAHKGISYYWENSGSQAVVLFVVEILPKTDQ